MKKLLPCIAAAFLLPAPSYAGDFKLSGTLAGKAWYTSDSVAGIHFPLRVGNAPKTPCTPGEEVNVCASWGMMYTEGEKKSLPGTLKEIARQINEYGGLGDSSFRAKKIIIGAGKEYKSPGY